MNKRNKNGITLIALIITIIVLLILAGVTISLVVGDNGILSKSTQAKADSIIAQEKEQMNLAYSAAFTKKLGNTVTREELQDELDKVVGEGKTAVTGTTTFKVKFKETNNEYSISQNGKVGEYEKPEVTSVYAAVCQNGYLVFSNNEADINNYLAENNTSLSDGYEIRDIKDDVYCQGHTDETTGEWIDDNFPVWKYNRNIKHAIFLNTVVPKTTAFWFCSLTDMVSIENIQNLSTGNVTDMSYMFNYCFVDPINGPRNLDLSGFDTSKVTDMSYMFAESFKNDEHLSLDLSSFDTRSVTNMSNMFQNCGIENLNLSSFDTRNVTNMSYMFSCTDDNASNFINLDLANFDTSNVTDMSGMFCGCYSLMNLDIRNFNINNLISWNSMFVGCTSLVNLNLSNVDTSNVTDMSCMFSGCNIKGLDLSSLDTSNVTDMSGMFLNCNIESLDLSSLDTSNVTDMSGMFSNCNIESLDLSNLDTSNVTDMSGMFQYCSSLTSLDVSRFNTSNVTDMSCMFYYCENLTNLDVSRFDTSKVTRMQGMFGGCSNLTSLDLSNFNTANVTNMEYMFYDCKNLTTIYVGPDWTTSNVENSIQMFGVCVSLVGGNGTTYNSSHTDKDYARVDNPPTNPGYFTLKSN